MDDTKPNTGQPQKDGSASGEPDTGVPPTTTPQSKYAVEIRELYKGPERRVNGGDRRVKPRGERKDRRITREEREEIYMILSEYRQKGVDTLRATKSAKEIFHVASRLFQGMIREKRLPKTVIATIRSFCLRFFSLLHELRKSKFESEDSEDDAISARVMTHAKTLAKVLMVDDTRTEVEYESVPLSLIIEELRILVPGIEDHFPKNIPSNLFALKGGIGRLVLKLYARMLVGAEYDDALIDSELPPADYDAIYASELSAKMLEIAREVGVDANGMEECDISTVEGMKNYFRKRDLTINQVLLTRDTLYFTKEALQAAITGEVRARIRRIIDLYGSDVIVIRDPDFSLEFDSARALHRLIKVIVEEKARSFWVPKYNFCMFVGIFYLVLLRKWMNKPKGLLYVARLFDIACQLGQNKMHIRKGVVLPCGRRVFDVEAKTPAEFIRYLFAMYPTFELYGELSVQETAAWYVEKFFVLFLKTVRRMYGIHRFMDLDVIDETPVQIVNRIHRINDEEKASIAQVLAEHKEHWEKARGSRTAKSLSS